MARAVKVASKDRTVMEDASSRKETDRARVSRAEAGNPRPAGVGTARKSYERKHGEKM